MQTPEFSQMSPDSQERVIDTILEQAANPANGDERGYFVNAANALDTIKNSGTEQ